VVRDGGFIGSGGSLTAAIWRRVAVVDPQQRCRCAGSWAWGGRPGDERIRATAAELIFGDTVATIESLGRVERLPLSVKSPSMRFVVVGLGVEPVTRSF